MKNMFINKRVISVFLTLSVISSLFFLGPAQALIVGFNVLDGVISHGETAQFKTSIQIEEETNQPTSLTLKLSGPQEIQCSFLPNGTLITSCPNINITPLKIPNQHGYGYLSPGKYEYEISLGTTNILSGQYQSIIEVETLEETIFSPEQLLFIKPIEKVEGCSVRAAGGTATLHEKTFANRNRLNLYVPSGNAIEGEGSFVAQNGDRISYKYTIERATQISENLIQFEVIGTLGKRSNTQEERATILLNKQTSKISIMGENLEANDLDVNFIRC